MEGESLTLRYLYLSLIREIKNSNFFLKEFIFKWAIISLLKFFRRRACKSILVFSVIVAWFAFDLLHSSSDCGAAEDTIAISTLFSSKHQLIFFFFFFFSKLLLFFFFFFFFDKNLHKVFCKIEPALLFKCNLLPVRCWVFKVFEWSIKGYKTITSQNASSEAQIKNFFIS